MGDVRINYDEGMKALSDNDPLHLHGKRKSLDDIMVAQNDTEDHNLKENVGTENQDLSAPELTDSSNYE